MCSRQKSLEFFLSAQHWMDAFPPPREQYYQRLYGYLKTQLSAPQTIALQTAAAQVATSPMATRPVSSVGAESHQFGAAELPHIEAQLAGYIGPVARHLVKRAALGANGVEELIARLTAELVTESDRCAFARRCRQIPGSRDLVLDP
jgi:hypothetical protein